MIGTLLIYVLYPLSRYLAERPAEVSRCHQRLPPEGENGTAETTSTTLEQIQQVQQIQQTQIKDMEESETAAEATAEEAEYWDEYLPDTADTEESSMLISASLKSSRDETQTGWHFPGGPGLAEEAWCPLQQFPAGSYYPPSEQPGPFEVVWRLWELTDENASAADTPQTLIPFSKASMDFTVMSYNILAQDLLEAHQQLYIHCPLEVLDWSYRCSLLLEEIQKWAPDILCLQEVQENHFYEHLHPVFSEMGYTCVYKRRTGTKTDGCATCFRSSCFTEMSVTPVEYFSPETELLKWHNVGIVLLLRPVVTRGSEVKAEGQPLCVANTHLVFNPRRGDVKLAQLAIMLAEMDSVVESCKSRGEQCNLVLCGDFNAVPDMPLYKLVTTGQLYFEGLPAWTVSGLEDLSHESYCRKLYAPLWPSCLEISDTCQYTTAKKEFTRPSHTPGKCQYSHDFLLQLRFCPAACVRPLDLELIPNVTDNTPNASKDAQLYYRFRRHIRHQFNLESVYKHVLPGSGKPEVTTLHSEVGATVDYIFYTPRHTAHSGDGDIASEGLKLIGSLSLLSEDVLWSMNGLPNHMFPSDHLSLLAKFQLDLKAA